MDLLPSTEGEPRSAAPGTWHLSVPEKQLHACMSAQKKAATRLSVVRRHLCPLLLNGGSIPLRGFLSLERQNTLFQMHSRKGNILFPSDPEYPHTTEPCSNPSCHSPSNPDSVLGKGFGPLHSTAAFLPLNSLSEAHICHVLSLQLCRLFSFLRSIS